MKLKEIFDQSDTIIEPWPDFEANCFRVGGPCRAPLSEMCAEISKFLPLYLSEMCAKFVKLLSSLLFI